MPEIATAIATHYGLSADDRSRFIAIASMVESIIGLPINTSAAGSVASGIASASSVGQVALSIPSLVSAFSSDLVAQSIASSSDQLTSFQRKLNNYTRLLEIGTPSSLRCAHAIRLEIIEELDSIINDVNAPMSCLVNASMLKREIVGD